MHSISYAHHTQDRIVNVLSYCLLAIDIGLSTLVPYIRSACCDRLLEEETLRWPGQLRCASCDQPNEPELHI